MAEVSDAQVTTGAAVFPKHPSALVETGAVGQGTRIGAFAHVSSGASLGQAVDIGSHVFIDHNVVIGDRVSIQHGAHLGCGLVVEDDVSIGPNVSFIGSSASGHQTGNTSTGTASIMCRARVGANAVILAGVTVGASAVVEPGAVVARDVPPNAIVAGNPARIVGYQGTSNVLLSSSTSRPAPDAVAPLPSLRVARAALRRLPRITDMRGALSFGEVQAHLPFDPKRFFAIYDVPGLEVRGEHAHKQLQQFLICLKGSCVVVLDDGRERDEVVLDTPEIGLYIPPMVWGIQYRYSQDALMLVLASDIYRAEDYIRDYDEFLGLVRS